MLKDLQSQLRSLKNSPEAGAVDLDRSKHVRVRVMQAIHHIDADSEYSAHGAVAFYRWFAFDVISRPMVVGVASFVLLFGGWMTSVNAASNSLPGDALYTLKRAGEYARLKLASSEKRAVLHTEFARRRYDELVALQFTPDRQAHFEIAVNDFQEQMGLATSQFQKVKDQNVAQVVVVAAQMDERLDALTTSIDGARSTSSTETAGETADVLRNSARRTQEVVVDAIIERHEGASIEDISSKELERLFAKELEALRRREAFDLGRVVVIEGAVAEEGLRELLTDVELRQLSFRITQAGIAMNDAVDLAAAGGWRSAFVIMREADVALKEIENELAAVELQIMQTRLELRAAAQQSVVEE